MNCGGEECKEQKEYFHKAERENNEDSNQYKILYNMNQNSFCARYYICLKSNCLVLQQELFREWHNDRLVPWLHFVSTGLNMDELPENTRYLLDNAEGKVVGASIAGATPLCTSLLLSSDFSTIIFQPLSRSSHISNVIYGYDNSIFLFLLHIQNDVVTPPVAPLPVIFFSPPSFPIEGLSVLKSPLAQLGSA